MIDWPELALLLAVAAVSFLVGAALGYYTRTQDEADEREDR